MLGVRKRKGQEDDVAKLNPVHLAVAGLLFGVIFVVSLVLIVRLVLASLS
jgi:hypothetical protein